MIRQSLLKYSLQQFPAVFNLRKTGMPPLKLFKKTLENHSNPPQKGTPIQHALL